MRTFLKENALMLLLSFSIPVIVMAVVYYQVGIYPGSKASLLATDSFAQYAPFHASFQRVLQGKESLFYTWSGSLGLNYWALAAYYLNGLFTPFVVFFDNATMPDTIYYLTLVKFGCSGLSFWLFAQQTFSINRWLVVGLSTSYALMSYSVGYSEVIMWLDTFVYLPLVILGIHRVMDKRKPILLFVSYLFLFLSNFYMAFMVGVFSFLYYWIRLFVKGPSGRSTIRMYLISSFLAGGASMVTILPAIIDLRSNGESFTKINRLLTPDTGPWDLIAKSMTGVYDTAKYESMPFIYIGLFPLIFCVFYFVSQKITRKEKVGYGFLLLVLIASVYLYPLNLFWHGFHAPNMFLFRFSYLVSFLVILLAGYGLQAFSSNERNQLVNTVLGLIGVFLLFLFVSNKKRYDVISMASLVVTMGLLVGYLFLCMVWQSPKRKQWMYYVFLVGMIGETGVNAQALVKGIHRDWGYPSRTYYTEPYKDVKALVDRTNQTSTPFFRLENVATDSLNSSFTYGFHGVSLFSSIRNRHSSQYLNALGFRSLGTNLTIDYANNTLLADTMVGMKYNISQQPLHKFGYKKVASSGKYGLYENAYAMPLGILTDEQIYEPGAAANQTELFNHLSGIEGELFRFRNAPLIDSKDAVVTEEESVIHIGEQEASLPRQVTWLVTVPAKTQAYLSLVTADWEESQGTEVELLVNGKKQKSKLNNTGQYYDLGYYEEARTVSVQTIFSGGDQQVTLYPPEAVFLDTKLFSASAQAIQKNGVDMLVEGRRASAEVTVSEKQTLLTTIPYDKGWRVLIDGRRAKITPFKEAFLTVLVPKGTHTLEFIYTPPGFMLGIWLFFGCLGLFVGYCWFLSRKEKGIGGTHSIAQQEGKR